MAPISSEQALRDLEHSSLPPVELLDLVQNIIGIDLLDLACKYEANPDYKSPALSFAPREEWVLRWLIKKLDSPANLSSTSDSPGTRFVLSKKTWLFFLYLVETIPFGSVFRILQDREFLPKFVDNLSSILQFGNGADPSGTANSPQQDEEQPRKRIKLSPPGAQEKISVPSLLSPNLPDLTVIICRLVCALAGTEPASPSQTDILTLGPDKAARLVSLLLEIVLQGLRHHGRNDSRGNWQSVAFLNSVSFITQFWDKSSHFSTGLTDVEKSHLYHVHCCKVSCALIDFLAEDAMQNNRERQIKRHLEHMLSLHSILPLRTSLNNKLKSGWVLDNKPLTWDVFEPVYSVVSQHFHMIADSQLDLDRDEDLNRASELASVLLDVALLSIPSTDMRRRQREQSWLEVLFLSLAYISCPPLPKIKDASNGTLHEEEVDQVPLRSTVNVECLVDVVLERKFTISLSPLSYLTSAIVAAQGIESPWLCLGKILKIDQNVLIPNSGFKGTDHCLQSVLQKIRQSLSKSEEHYDILRDHIIIPLISGFAQARDLGRFVEIWQVGLEDTIALQGLEEAESASNRHLGQVWEDEDVFDAFKRVMRVHGIPSLSKIVLAKAIEETRSLETRVGSTKDVFARLAVLDALLVCRREDFVAAETSMKELIDAIESALTVQSTYQSQRWRLWRIIRRCLFLLADSHLANKYLQLKSSLLRPVRLAAVVNALENDNSSSRSVDFKEAIECFHILAAQVAGSQSEADDLLRSEVAELGSLLTFLSGDSKILSTKKQKAAVSNLSTNIFKNGSAFAQECVGILCQNPKSLLVNSSTTSALLVSLYQFCKSWKEEQNGLPFSSLLEAVLSLDEIGSSSTLYQQCFKTLMESIHEDKRIPKFVYESFQQMPLAPIRRSQLQNLATSLMDRFRGANSPQSPPDLIVLLQLLEKLAKFTAVGIGKPENWKQLVDLVNLTSTLITVPSSREYQMSVRCFQSIFSSLWGRIFVLETNEKNRRLVAEMLSWCTEEVKERPHLRYGLSSFVILEGFMNGFWTNKDAPVIESLEKKIKSLRKAYFANLLRDLRQLTATAFDGQIFPLSLKHIVRALSGCSDLCGKSEDLKSVKMLVDSAMKDWKETSNTEFVAGFSTASILEDSRIRLNKLNASSSLPSSQERPHEQRFDRILHAAPNCDLEPNTKRLRWVIQNITSFTTNDRLDFLASLQARPSLGPVRYEFIAAIAYGTTQAELYGTPQLAQRLHELVSLQYAMEADSPEEICLALESVKMILHNHPGVVNQWGVDNLLSSVALLASTSTAHTNTEPQAWTDDRAKHAIFDRLCDLLGIVLARFRRRLQGRYHLLLLATQNLLRCLFYPGSILFEASQLKSHLQVQFLESLPSWMRNSAEALSPSSAKRFSRVLNAICDPTTSSVKSSSRGRPRLTAELTDETKKAKRSAGQYMQYLIVEYAKCSLEGQIRPEVKEKLMPGLYAVLDVMPRELMRAMNAAMDASSRAIFKGLYDDYQRFGKWDKN